MEVNEFVVINKPHTIQCASLKQVTWWTKASILSAIWNMRKKIMEEKGVDIFQVYEMSDCIEVHIEGEFKTIPAMTKHERVAKLKMFRRRR